jgi:FixJ family two-component response regulator
MSSGRVFLVDDDVSILRALSRLLKEADFDVQAFQSPEDFLIHHDMKTPGCAVFDVGLGSYNGLELLRALARTGQMRPTIFITGRGDIETSVRAMKSGAVDFLTKPIHEDELIEAVRRGIERDRRDREQGAKLAAIAKRLSSLTPKESEVLTRVVAGRLNKQIAGDLGISEKTVKVHRGRVMAKMGVRTVADLVRTVEPTLIHLLSGGPMPESNGRLVAQQEDLPPRNNRFA